MPAILIEFRSSYAKNSFTANLDKDSVSIIGSGADSTIRLEGSGILSQHARIKIADEGLLVESVNNAPVAVNGCLITSLVHLYDGDWLALDNSLFQVRIMNEKGVVETSHKLTPSGSTICGNSTHFKTIFTVGRLPDCDIQVDSPIVSREHARLIWGADGWILEDQHSTNGTFVNKKRLVGCTLLHKGDRVEIATFAFLFTGDALHLVDTEGRVRIEAHNLYKEIKDRISGQPRRLLNKINLVIEPGEFVGIFGTSGSGKSTLLDALNGRRPATGGEVIYNHADLYKAFDQFRSAIGYVPQQDIVHRKITVRHALDYTARLRLPPDTTQSEIDAYIVAVLERVGLADKADLPIDTPAPLSGGQLKRVSLAVELVANPKVLFLDEVTSGLDAGTDKKMMHLFRELAADHKTVICVTHTLENIDDCHLVVLLHQGELVYFGPPQQVTKYFEIQRPSQVYELLECAQTKEWVDKYLNSIYYQTYVTDRLSESAREPEQEPELVIQSPEKRRWFSWSQANTLMRRYLDLIFSDRRNLAILLFQAPLIAAVIGLVFRTDDPLPARAAVESQISFVLVLSAIWFGCLNSARELVKELPIYLRERSVNLKIIPYLASKVFPLAVLCGLQCLFLLAIVSTLASLSGDFLYRFWVLFLAGMAATTMGLAVSAVVDSNDKAVAMVPILLIPQVVLSDAIVSLGDISLALAKATIISFWAFDAMKTTLSAETLAAKDPAGQVIILISGTYCNDLSAIAILGLIFLIAASCGLKLKDRKQ